MWMIAAPLLLLALQQWTLGTTVTSVVEAGAGVAHECSGYPTALGARVTAPVSSKKHLRLEVNGRAYGLGSRSSCVIVGPEPFREGVLIEEERVNLLADPHLTTDLRLVRSLSQDAAAIAVGLGNAWRAGHDLPYVVVAGSAQFVTATSLRVGFGLEYQLFRVTSDRFSRLYSSRGQLIWQQAFGQVHMRSHAVVLGFHVELPL